MSGDAGQRSHAASAPSASDCGPEPAMAAAPPARTEWSVLPPPPLRRRGQQLPSAERWWSASAGAQVLVIAQPAAGLGQGWCA